MEMMKALVKYAHGPGNMEVREVPKPVAGPGEVLIKVACCALDRGGDGYVWQSTEGMRFNVPVTGRAEAFFCGDYLFISPLHGDAAKFSAACRRSGKCEHCLKGNYLMCENTQTLGRWINGAYAQYYTINEKRVHKVPDNVSMRAAALCEVSAVATRNLVEHVNIKAGDTVAIIGPGPVGLCGMQIAKACGASKVVVIGRRAAQYRMDLALELGADALYYTDEEDYVEKIRADFPNGFDVACEVTGFSGGPELAIKLCKPGGKVAAIGTGIGHNFSVPWAEIPMKDLTVIGTYAHTWSSWELTLDLMAKGLLKTEKFLTKQYPLEQWETAFEEVVTNLSEDIIRVGICPNGEI